MKESIIMAAIVAVLGLGVLLGGWILGEIIKWLNSGGM